MNLMDLGGLGGGGGGTEYVVKLRGLPWAATKEDILEFFDDCRIDGGREGIHLVQGQGGRSTGEAFVEPCSDSDLDGFTKKDRKTIGHRYIEVFRVKRTEMEWHVRREKGGGSGGGRDDGSFGGGGRFGEAADNFVRLRGLPFECSKEDIQSFFEGLSVGSVQLMVDGLGRSTGEAYVEFTGGKGDADRALLRDRGTIGHRYIEVFRVGPSELKSMSAMSSPRNSGGGGGGPLRNNQMNSNNRPRPYSYQGRDCNGRPPFGGGGGPSFRMPMRYHSKGFEDDYMLESSYGGGGGGGGWNKLPPPPPPPSYGGMHLRRSGGGGRPSGGGNDCLLMRGLPYSAGEQEIIRFFEPLVPAEIDVILDSSGRASGTAKVQFGTKDDLTRAMAKHKERMDHRYIELFLHSTNP